MTIAGGSNDAGDPGLAAAAREGIEWLYEEPPYALVGRVICEASAVELGLLQCAALTTALPQELGKKTARDLMKLVRRSGLFDPPLTEGVLTRISEALRLRDELAHGAPMNLPNRPHAHGFVKGSRPGGGGFQWVGFEEEELEALAIGLRDLSDLLQTTARTSSESGT